jgi:hypothetical protein
MNVYYQLSTNEIFTYDYSQSCGQAMGLSSTIRHGTFFLFKNRLRSAIKSGLVVKLGKLY